MMVFAKEDKVVMKFLGEIKRYGAKRIPSEFPTNEWTFKILLFIVKVIHSYGPPCILHILLTTCWARDTV